MKINKYTIDSQPKKLNAEWTIDIEDVMVKSIREEIDRELTYSIMTSLWETELKTLQVKYRPIAEAHEQFEDKKIPEYAQFILDYELPKFSAESDETYFDIQSLESDMGELLHGMSEVDQFTYNMVFKG